MKRKISSFAICAAVALMVSGCVEETTSPSENNTTAQVTTKETTAQETTTEEPTTTEKSAYGIGEQVEKDNIKITLVNVRETSGSDYNTAPDGKIFVLAEFLVENDSEEEITISSLLDFDAYIDGFATDIDFSATMEADKQLDGTCASGKKLQGEIGLEAPTDWKELSISFKLNFLSSDSIEFIYTK